jgi:transaldolase
MAASPEVIASPLQRMSAATATDYWNDSSSVEELAYAVARGATGATSNPTIVGEVLKKELHHWRDRIPELIANHPTWVEDEVTMKLFEEISVRGAAVLLPVFERTGGKKGRLSIQTNPKLYRDPDRLTEQAVYFASLAPNMQVKVPATEAGILAAENATAAGVTINVTVCFTVPQTLAAGEAIERGLRRREIEGEDTSVMSPVVTMMVGRLDDWIQVLVKRDGVLVDPGYPHWAGIACAKKAYQIVRERKYRVRLLAAAYRHHLHWTEFVGGDMVLTIPHVWQKLFNGSDLTIVERIDNPVPEEIVDELYRRFDDFRRAYDVDGMTVSDFDSYGASVRTLRTFIKSYEDLVSTVRDYMLPNPDV